MFTLAKLTSLFLGTLAVGSIGGVVTPIVIGFSSFLWAPDTSKWELNIEELEKTEKEISDKLTSSKIRYSSALAWLEKLKTFNFEKIIETFANLFKTEEDIETKYKDVQTKLQELIQLTEKQGSTSIQKLEADKESNLFDTYSKGFSALNKSFDSWEREFQKIICALENKEESNCNKGVQPLLKSVLGWLGVSSTTQDLPQQSSISAGGGTQTRRERKS